MSIPNHFAVMCLMEDLIGSPDAESEESMIASRARAVAQLASLANTMGRDWCENEIVPFLMRLALEDEESVSVAAAEQTATLCDTRYFDKSPELQHALVLSVGVGFLTSTHKSVRDVAVKAVRRACIICDPANPEAMLLRVVQRLLFETSFPTSVASGLCLLGPSVVDVNSCSKVALSPLVVPRSSASSSASSRAGASQDDVSELAFAMLTQLLAPAGGHLQDDAVPLVARLRLEAAICGATGRVTIIDSAIMQLLRDLVIDAASSSSTSVLGGHRNEHRAASFLFSYLLDHVISSACPSCIFLRIALPMLAEMLDAIVAGGGTRPRGGGGNDSQQQLHLSVVAGFSRVIRDWASCDDWAVRFEIATAAPVLFESLLRASAATGGSSGNNGANKFAAGNMYTTLALELLQTAIPRLVGDDEVEVSTVAAGGLPRLVACAERHSAGTVELGRLAVQCGGDLRAHLLGFISADKMAQPSVQEAVAAALGAGVGGAGTVAATTTLNNNNNIHPNAAPPTTYSASSFGGSAVVASSGASLSGVAHETLLELLAACQDDAVRVSIVESLLWSSVVACNNNNNNKNGSSRATAGRLLTDELRDQLRGSLASLMSDSAPNWRTRDRLASSVGKMVVCLLNSDFRDPEADDEDDVVAQFCSQYVVAPFVHLIFDRFWQVRTSALAPVVEARGLASSGEAGGRAKKLARLWRWVCDDWQARMAAALAASGHHQQRPQSSSRSSARHPHYQARIAHLVAAVVCATERELLAAGSGIIEQCAADPVANVRRAAALALMQGCRGRTSAGFDGGASGAGATAPPRSAVAADLVPSLTFAWSNMPRVLALMQQLVADESADVREVAGAGLALCAS